MTEIEFLKELRTAVFSKEVYAKMGLDDDYINKQIEAYNPRPKRPSQTISSNDPLIRLVNDYDLSKTEIGMISFEPEVTETEDYYYVGKDEVDFLCISRFSHEVVLVPFDAPLDIACKCAQNSSLFLEAIVTLAKFMEKRSIDDDLYNDQAAAVAMAEYCSEIAGGDQYLNFYKYLLGCL